MVFEGMRFEEFWSGKILICREGEMHAWKDLIFDLSFSDVAFFLDFLSLSFLLEI